MASPGTLFARELASDVAADGALDPDTELEELAGASLLDMLGAVLLLSAEVFAVLLVVCLGDESSLPEDSSLLLDVVLLVVKSELLIDVDDDGLILL